MFEELSDFSIIGDIRTAGRHQAALVIITDAQGRLLMQLRDPDKPIAFPGHWSLFGGSVEEGESPRQAAQREIEEEIGLDFPAADFKPLAVTCAGGQRHSLVYFFSLATRLAPEQIVLREGSGFAFLQSAQIKALTMVPYIVPVLELFWQSHGRAPA